MDKLIISIITGVILGTLIVLMPLLIFNTFLKTQISKPTMSLSNVSSTTSEGNYPYLPTITKAWSPTNTIMSLTSPFSFEAGKASSVSINVYDKVFLIVIVSLIIALVVFLYAKRSIG